MRYFLISYLYEANTGQGFGHVSMNFENFPNETQVSEIVQRVNSPKYKLITPVVIMNVYEFKSEKDYDSFHDKKHELLDKPMD